MKKRDSVLPPTISVQKTDDGGVDQNQLNSCRRSPSKKSVGLLNAGNAHGQRLSRPDSKLSILDKANDWPSMRHKTSRGDATSKLSSHNPD